jgi:hypothetical protein
MKSCPHVVLDNARSIECTSSRKVRNVLTRKQFICSARLPWVFEVKRAVLFIDKRIMHLCAPRRSCMVTTNGSGKHRVGL